MKIIPTVFKICPDKFGPIGPFTLDPRFSAQGVHILHTFKISSNKLKKQVSGKLSGLTCIENFWQNKNQILIKRDLGNIVHI